MKSFGQKRDWSLSFLHCRWNGEEATSNLPFVWATLALPPFLFFLLCVHTISPWFRFILFRLTASCKRSRRWSQCDHIVDSSLPLFSRRALFYFTNERTWVKYRRPLWHTIERIPLKRPSSRCPFRCAALLLFTGFGLILHSARETRW